MFAGTESSTSVPTPARLRIFSLAAYTHRSPDGNVLEAGEILRESGNGTIYRALA